MESTWDHCKISASRTNPVSCMQSSEVDILSVITVLLYGFVVLFRPVVTGA